MTIQALTTPALITGTRGLGKPHPGELRLFGHASCPQCKIAGRLLGSLNVSYRHLDVREDADVVARVRALGHSGVPVVETIAGSCHGLIPDDIRDPAQNAQTYTSGART
jgi:glutaredoxin